MRGRPRDDKGGAAGAGAKPASARKTRVEHSIRDTLTELIAADVKDPRVHAPAMLTISRVELNVDMSVARCYVSIVGDDATADDAIAGLVKAAGFLRGPVGRRLGLQRAPELRFMLDPSVDMSAKLAAIVREDEERARAAGRDAASDQPAAPRTDDKPSGASARDQPATPGTDDKPRGVSASDPSAAGRMDDKSSGVSASDPSAAGRMDDKSSGASASDPAAGRTDDKSSGASASDPSAAGRTDDKSISTAREKP